jgi:hypothetical protein
MIRANAAIGEVPLTRRRTSAWHIGSQGRSVLPDVHHLLERTDVRCYGIKDLPPKRGMKYLGKTF